MSLDCACKPGFYDAGDDSECPACTYPCENCTSTSCISNFYISLFSINIISYKFIACVHTAHRVDSSSCDCLPGYYDDNTQC